MNCGNLSLSVKFEDSTLWHWGTFLHDAVYALNYGQYTVLCPPKYTRCRDSLSHHCNSLREFVFPASETVGSVRSESWFQGWGRYRVPPNWKLCLAHWSHFGILILADKPVKIELMY